MIIKPKVRGFICTTAHPAGCAAHVQEQIGHVLSKGPFSSPAKKALIIGASTGYGLSSRIALAFGGNAATLGVMFERPAEADRTGTAGWYNTAAFEKAARDKGLWCRSLNGDAFSDDVKTRTIEMIRQELGQVDMVVYSLASPRRTHPKTGTVSKSVLKPVGATFTSKTVDVEKRVVSQISIEPASEQEIADTVSVMGGEDWEMWMEALAAAGVLAPGATTVAYSYIGPEVTWAVYRNGTIGRAKEHLEQTAARLRDKLPVLQGRAWVSVNKALVTQASSAIPVVPLYISLLYKVMKAKGLHEGCIEQMQRLFSTHLCGGKAPVLDGENRIRVDDWEMRPDIQQEVAGLWEKVSTENLVQTSDIEGYDREFLKLFGFGLPGIDTDKDVDPVVPLQA